MEASPIFRETRSHHLEFGDAKMPLISIKGSNAPNSTDEQDDFPTIVQFMQLSADANGSDDTKLIVFLNIGSTSAVYDQYQFSAASAAVTDPNSGTAATVTHTQCLTLGALVKAIRAVAGMECFRLHGSASLSINTDDFIDITAFDMLSSYYTKTLYQDASEVNVFTMRVGNPQEYDRGRMNVISLSGICTSASGGTVDIFIDPDDEVATNVKLIRSFAISAAQNAYIDADRQTALTYQGPILVVVTDSSATDVDIVLNETQADY